MPYISVGKENSGDIDLYYEDHGTGKPVILVHGWPLNGASWEKQVPVLLKAGYRVLTYDRRGFGKSSQPTTGYNYDTLAADLHTLIAKLDLHDVSLFGFSMGGGEVARYLGKYKAQRVAKAGFIAAIPPFLLKTADNPEGADAAMFEGIQKSIAADRPAFIASFLQNFYNVDVLGGSRISKEAVNASWNVAMGASYTGTHDCVQAWLEDFRKDLSAIKIPILVVHGDQDRILPIAITGERMQAMIPGSRLVKVEGGPHGLNWTHAEILNSAMLEFLKS
jgi:pimeloyl-ACP methyl ester carboxylesterase